MRTAEKYNRKRKMKSKHNHKSYYYLLSDCIMGIFDLKFNIDKLNLNLNKSFNYNLKTPSQLHSISTYYINHISFFIGIIDRQYLYIVF